MKEEFMLFNITEQTYPYQVIFHSIYGFDIKPTSYNISPGWVHWFNGTYEECKQHLIYLQSKSINYENTYKK